MEATQCCGMQQNGLATCKPTAQFHKGMARCAGHSTTKPARSQALAQSNNKALHNPHNLLHPWPDPTVMASTSTPSTAASPRLPLHQSVAPTLHSLVAFEACKAGLILLNFNPCLARSLPLGQGCRKSPFAARMACATSLAALGPDDCAPLQPNGLMPLLCVSASTSEDTMITITYFGAVKQLQPSGVETLEWNGGTTADLLDLLRARDADWAQALEAKRIFKIAINKQLLHTTADIQDGDEVAILPPVTGG